MKPAAEIAINEDLALRLLAEQYPDLSHLPLEYLDSGWDNVIYRLGDRFCLRLPRRQLAATLIENEQTWLPRLQDFLTLPIPLPWRIGQPTAYYPWRWSILPWLEGLSAESALPGNDQAKIFGSFLKSLHQLAPLEAPSNPFRGGSLTIRAQDIEARLQRIEPEITQIYTQVREIWQYVLDIPLDVSSRWLHGDLHPGNVLVLQGKITGIIDWGDLTSGDIATDLAGIWMLFPDSTTRKEAIAEYGDISPATWSRAIGWAIYFGVTLLDVGLAGNQKQAVVGARTLACVTDDWFSDR